MKWNFEVQGDKATVKKFIDAQFDEVLKTGPHKGEVKGTVTGNTTPEVVMNALKAMVDDVNFKPDHPDPTKTYSVRVRSDGQGDDIHVSGRFEITRLIAGK